LAATLVHQPELIFLDEPTAGVDPVLRNKFWDYFREQRDEGRTFFITTQYVTEAAYCDLVGLLSDGRLIALDTPGALRRQAFGGDWVDLKVNVPLDHHHLQTLHGLPCVNGPITQTSGPSVCLIVHEAGTAIPMLLDWAREQDMAVNAIEEYLPPFDEVFVRLVNGSEGAESD
jgi:ABC-2 type transport system ATP-binding protein